MIGNFKANEPQASQTKNKNPISNESNKDVALNKSIQLDKSRSSSRTETKDTVKPQNKIISILSASLDDNLSVSGGATIVMQMHAYGVQQERNKKGKVERR